MRRALRQNCHPQPRHRLTFKRPARLDADGDVSHGALMKALAKALVT